MYKKIYIYIMCICIHFIECYIKSPIRNILMYCAPLDESDCQIFYVLVINSIIKAVINIEV